MKTINNLIVININLDYLNIIILLYIYFKSFFRKTINHTHRGYQLYFI